MGRHLVHFMTDACGDNLEPGAGRFERESSVVFPGLEQEQVSEPQFPQGQVKVTALPFAREKLRTTRGLLHNTGSFTVTDKQGLPYS